MRQSRNAVMPSETSNRNTVTPPRNNSSSQRFQRVRGSQPNSLDIFWFSLNFAANARGYQSKPDALAPTTIGSVIVGWQILDLARIENWQLEIAQGGILQ